MANQYTSKKAKEAAAKEKARAKPVASPLRKQHSPFPEILFNVHVEALPKFVIEPHDNFAPLVIKEWIRLAVQHKVPADKINGVRDLLKRVEEYRTANPTKCKNPD